jgi:protoporphyrinogen oxidase
VADLVRAQGGEIHLGHKVDRVHLEHGRITAVETVNQAGERATFSGDYFLSTMPVQDLVAALQAPVPAEVCEVSRGLLYRDFITVGLLVRKLAVTDPGGTRLRDNWIYVQEPEVQLGRLQIFNNWSPQLVSDPEKIWLGLEYFCNQSDPVWQLDDGAMARMAIEELQQIGLLHAADVEDWHVVRVPKTYPAYFGSYGRFHVLRQYLDRIDNLFLIGRNGMHKYNNQDHSMLTAITAVENIAAGITSKDNLWAINTETEYHEAKSQQQPTGTACAAPAR